MTTINQASKTMAEAVRRAGETGQTNPAEVRQLGLELLDKASFSSPFSADILQKLGDALLLAADQLAASTTPPPSVDDGVTA